MKTVGAMLLWAAAAYGQIHVVDHVYRADGTTPAVGTIEVVGTRQGSTGVTVLGSRTTVTIGPLGQVDVYLVGGVGVSYTATYYLTDRTRYSEAWVVPAGTGTYTIRDLWGTVPAPGVLVSLGQLNVAGAANGTYCLQVAGGVVTGLAACSGGGGGGGTVSWAALTNGQWAALTNGQWTGLGN